MNPLQACTRFRTGRSLSGLNGQDPTEGHPTPLDMERGGWQRSAFSSLEKGTEAPPAWWGEKEERKSKQQRQERRRKLGGGRWTQECTPPPPRAPKQGKRTRSLMETLGFPPAGMCNLSCVSCHLDKGGRPHLKVRLRAHSVHTDRSRNQESLPCRVRKLRPRNRKGLFGG